MSEKVSGKDKVHGGCGAEGSALDLRQRVLRGDSTHKQRSWIKTDEHDVARCRDKPSYHGVGNSDLHCSGT